MGVFFRLSGLPALAFVLAVNLEAGEFQWLTQGYLGKWSFSSQCQSRDVYQQSSVSGNELAECGFLQVGRVGMGHPRTRPGSSTPSLFTWPRPPSHWTIIAELLSRSLIPVVPRSRKPSSCPASGVFQLVIRTRCCPRLFSSVTVFDDKYCGRERHEHHISFRG